MIAHAEMICLNEKCFKPLEILVKYFVLNCDYRGPGRRADV